MKFFEILYNIKTSIIKHEDEKQFCDESRVYQKIKQHVLIFE